MPTPEFIVSLREKIGHESLWLSGVTAVVRRDDGDVLLARRADDGQWTSVTGIIDPGEEPADAAEREVLEEAGLVVVAERLAWVHVLPPHTWPNGDRAQFLDLVFGCRYVSGEPSPADGENTEVGWFGLDDLPEVSATQRERIEAALAGGVARFERHGG
ncbi:NUDIX hydrolase [Propionibacteriaceae bacterium Y2011]